MRKRVLLGAAWLALPAAASSTVLEGHFSGRADHSGGTPGVYAVGETYVAYLKLDTVQENPWYPWTAGRQYTAVLTTTVASYSGVSNPQSVTWNPATVRIYEDNPGGGGTSADFSNTATFTDGTEILNGTISSMSGQRTTGVDQPWGVIGNLALTGGAGLANLDAQCANGNMVLNDFINFQTPPGSWPDTDGYEEAYNAKWECPGTVGTQEATWGRVKAGYR